MSENNKIGERIGGQSEGKLTKKEVTRFKRKLDKELSAQPQQTKQHPAKREYYFKKGSSGNPIGRVPGSVSTKTRIIKEFTQDILSGGAIKFKHEFSKLKGKQYLDVYLALMEYAVPKLQRVESTNINVEVKEKQVIKIGETEFTIN